MPARPGNLSFRTSKHAFAPGEPAIVRRQPSTGRRHVTRVKAQISREAVKEESFLVDQVTWLRRRSVREQAANLLPGAIRVATVAGEEGVRRGDLPTEAGI